MTFERITAVPEMLEVCPASVGRWCRRQPWLAWSPRRWPPRGSWRLPRPGGRGHRRGPALRGGGLGVGCRCARVAEVPGPRQHVSGGRAGALRSWPRCGPCRRGAAPGRPPVRRTLRASCAVGGAKRHMRHRRDAMPAGLAQTPCGVSEGRLRRYEGTAGCGVVRTGPRAHRHVPCVVRASTRRPGSRRRSRGTTPG